MAFEFCEVTRQDWNKKIYFDWKLWNTLHNFYPFRREITKITQKRKLEIDNKLLTYAIQRTILFEQLLTKRFLGRSIPKPTPLPNQEEISDDDWKPFLGVISQCFDAHFDIYVNFTDL